MFEVRKEILESHEAVLEVVFEPEAVEEAKHHAVREISRQMNIPGFRKGKAPYGKVVQYVGEPALLQEAAEHLIHEHYPEFLEKAEVSPYGPGDFVDMEPDPLTFRIRVPLEPEVDLGDYRSLREEWTDPTVSDEELDQVLEQIREEHAVLEPIEGPAAWGHELRISVHASVAGDVVVDEHDVPVVLSETRPFLSMEFVEALLGVTTGEERTFTATLPETIEEPTLRGVEAEFEVKVEQVFERTLPDLDDALASTVGSFETFADLTQDIRDRILAQKRQQVEAGYHEKLVDKLVEQSEMHYPPQLVEDTLDDMVKTVNERVQRQQRMSLEDALRLQGRTMDQYREDMRPEADARAREILVLRALAVKEGVQVSNEEVVQEYAHLLNQLGMAGRMSDMPLNTEDALAQNLRASVLERKVRNRLTAIARGEMAEGEDEPVVMSVAAEDEDELGETADDDGTSEAAE